MASFWYHRAARDVAKGDVDLDTAPITVVLMGTATTVSAGGAQGADAATVHVLSSGSATFDHYTGTNGGRKDLLSANTTITQDDANNRTEFLRSNVSYASLASDASGATGILLYLGSSTDNDTDNVPLAYLDISTFNGNGGNVTVSWNAEGILQYVNTNAP